jgi:hypothetical protein
MRDLTNDEKTALSKIVADPVAWWAHANSAETIDHEATLASKLARWAGVYDNTKAERDAIIEAENSPDLTVDQARRIAYGDIGDQLDMQYHDLVDGTTTWVDHIATVKAARPKP